MTEIEYRKLLIDSVRAGDYPEKDGLLELLKICSLRFEKTNIFTRNQNIVFDYLFISSHKPV